MNRTKPAGTGVQQAEGTEGHWQKDVVKTSDWNNMGVAVRRGMCCHVCAERRGAIPTLVRAHNEVARNGRKGRQSTEEQKHRVHPKQRHCRFITTDSGPLHRMGTAEPGWNWQ